MGSKKVLQAKFYQSESGKEPVREWLHSLSHEDKKAIGNDIKTVEFGWPQGMPLCEHLENGILEVRTNLKDKIARVLFCIQDDTMYLLVGIIKKTQKTPKESLNLAKKRKRRLFNGN
jgi:phage-related protein